MDNWGWCVINRLPILQISFIETIGALFESFASISVIAIWYFLGYWWMSVIGLILYSFLVIDMVRKGIGDKNST